MYTEMIKWLIDSDMINRVESSVESSLDEDGKSSLQTDIKDAIWQFFEKLFDCMLVRFCFLG